MIVLHRLVTALLLYSFFVLVLFALRPSLMFDAAGKPKDFGVGLEEGRSVFALSMILPLGAFMSYIIACTIQFAIA